MKQDTHFFFLGGYRQDHIEPGNAYSSFVKQLNNPSKVTINLWQGKGDSLRQRWLRIKRIAKDLTNVRVIILGYSMGCHIGVKLANYLRKRKVDVASTHLLAPDPKFKKGPLDELDVLVHNQRSAYEEAKELWNTKGAPGKMFSSRLSNVIEFCPSVQIVYSIEDSVAEWDGNVELLYENNKPKSKLVWTRVGIPSNSKRKTCWRISLSPQEVDREDWIHEQIFQRAIFSKSGVRRVPGINP